MQVRLLSTGLSTRTSRTRLPFRYGQACLTECPQATFRARVQLSDGTQQEGFSGDCLPPGWFDKNPNKGYPDQLHDMRQLIDAAAHVFQERFSSPQPFFPAWLDAQQAVEQLAAEEQLPPLLAALAVSLPERAMLDAIARATHQSFAQLVRGDLLGWQPEQVHPELAGMTPKNWLPAKPLRRIHVRHTVGLADPLTLADVPPGDRLDDGYPEVLEQYITQTGVRYFKVKLSNQPDHDQQRLRDIASLLEHHLAGNYGVTLDGNEQYGSADELDSLIASIREDPALATFWDNTLVVEQPLARRIALDPQHAETISRLATHKRIIIDESDGPLDAFRQAIEVGYRGVSSKNCKGPIRSILNAGLIAHSNQRTPSARLIMTAEDLCCVGIIPVQSDLCLVATLGLSHSERNGHHYHPGISYLPADQQETALRVHADFYCRSGQVVRPWVRDGQFHIDSLLGVGYGFDVLPDPTEDNAVC